MPATDLSNCVCCCVGCVFPCPAALLQQRVAGLVYCFKAWVKWYEKTAAQLREDLEKVAKAKTQAQEKAGKAAKDTALQDAERKQKLDQVRAYISVACGCLTP